MVHVTSRRLMRGAALVAALASLTACTTNRQVEFAPSTSRAPTVTVTVTVTADPNTSPLSLPSSLTTLPPSLPPTLPGPTPAPTTGATTGVFNRALADQHFKSLVTDISVLDGQFSSRTSPSLRLDIVAKQYGTLFTLGVPPGLDGPSYLSRLRTLEMFAAAAAQESLTDLTRAAQRYQVVRRETGLLLGQVNAVLGTNYVLPTATPSPTSTLTAPPR
jgi:hypothetical protein